MLAAGVGPDGLVKVWITTTGYEVITLSQMEGGHSSWVESVAFSPDGSLLATASLDGTAMIWELARGRLLYTLSEHAAGVRDLAFSPNGRWLATLGDDWVVMLWEVETGQRMNTIPSSSNGNGLDISPDGNQIATTTASGIAELWDPLSGERHLTEREHARWLEDVAFSPDGARLALASADNTASVWVWLPESSLILGTVM